MLLSFPVEMISHHALVFQEHFDTVDVFLDAQLERQVDDALADATASSDLDFATHFGSAAC